MIGKERGADEPPVSKISYGLESWFSWNTTSLWSLRVVAMHGFKKEKKKSKIYGSDDYWEEKGRFRV